jgi:hypothetical protein
MERSDIPTWFHQVWAAVPSLGQRPADHSAVSGRSGLSPVPVSGGKSPEFDRFETFVAEQLAALPSPSMRLDLDRLIVRLAIKLHRTLVILKSDSERFQSMITFLDALESIEELRLVDVEPPELVRTVHVEVPASKPKKPEKPGGLWFAKVDD